MINEENQTLNIKSTEDKENQMEGLIESDEDSALWKI